MSVIFPFTQKYLQPRLEQIKNNEPCLSSISGKLISLINSGTVINEGEKLNLKKYVSDILLYSSFFAEYFTNICLTLMEKEIDDMDMLKEMIKDASSKKDIREVINLLLSASNYTNSEALRKLNNLNDVEILPFKDEKYLKMCEKEQYLIDKGYLVNDLYFYYKKQKRFNLALKIITDDYEQQIEREKLTSREISNILNGLKKKSLELKNYFFENKDDYLLETYLMINDGLHLCEKISDMRLEGKIDLARSILEEIEYLKINRGSSEKLKILIGRFEDPKNDLIFRESYMHLSIDEIKEYIEQDRFDILGINEKIWREISDSRKDDLITLLNCWIKLKNTVTTYDDIQKQGMFEQFSRLLIDLNKSLARICSLYITNEDRKIGFEPFDEWKLNKQLPFTFTTKIRNPKCESLNQNIRIYTITDKMLGSKVYINNIRDHISEKNYHLNSFAVIFLLGDKDKFVGINTNPITKDLPVLDEFALKKIIFASDTKKIEAVNIFV